MKLKVPDIRKKYDRKRSENKILKSFLLRRTSDFHVKEFGRHALIPVLQLSGSCAERTNLGQQRGLALFCSDA